MDYIDKIGQYAPLNEQEAADKGLIVSYIQQFRHNVLLRDNAIAHITSSGFTMNRQLDKVLLVLHNIRNAWAWTGGHADGDCDLLRVAIREASEETGASTINPLSKEIASLDVLPVFSHIRKGAYVSAHLHLSVAYILVCDETETIRPQLSKNSAVKWFSTDYFTEKHFDSHDTYLYNKLINKALTFKDINRTVNGGSYVKEQ